MSTSSPLSPPAGYSSWLAYAVAEMETRRLYQDHACGNQPQWPGDVTREQMREAAEAELQNLLFKGARADAAGVEEEVLTDAGGCAGDAEFAAAIGCSVGELESLLTRNECLCLVHLGVRYWPRWQLGLPGLPNVLSILSAKVASGFSVAAFFTTQTHELSLDDSEELPDVREDDSPLSLLRRCGPAAIPRVVRHAHRFWEQGGS